MLFFSEIRDFFGRIRLNVSDWTPADRLSKGVPE